MISRTSPTVETWMVIVGEQRRGWIRPGSLLMGSARLSRPALESVPEVTDLPGLARSEPFVKRGNYIETRCSHFAGAGSFRSGKLFEKFDNRLIGEFQRLVLLFHIELLLDGTGPNHLVRCSLDKG